MRLGPLAAALLLLTVGLAGCIGGEDGEAIEEASQGVDELGNVSYEVPEPDPSIGLIESSTLVPTISEDVEIHVRLIQPDIEGPVPVIVEFTPYNAPGRAMVVEPMVSEPGGTFVREFVQRGFAFAYADVRGTADSGGCLDLRGQMDIEDAGALTAWLGTQDWSNGKVGFIGASYPGSEAHIAALANDEHLGGVIPVVASTSFYNYHHKAGVPYSNHLFTNAGYTAFATAPTANPQYENWLTRQAYEGVECDQEDHLARGLDQSGTYDSWWRDRDLQWRTDAVEVPVLMAQGLADWNVKPDHIATWFNDIDTNKTLIAGQWGHQYPNDAEEAYGGWWAMAAAFFDETLNGIHTGLFDQDRAYVQDTTGTWQVYADAWPPLDASWTTLNLTSSGLDWTAEPSGELTWHPEAWDQEIDEDDQVILEGPVLDERLQLSGTPHLNLTVVTEVENVHLVAVLEVQRDGEWVRENYGYLNPIYRTGLETPERVVPGEPTPVTIEFYPQEDVFEPGDQIRLRLASSDEGRTVPAYETGAITAVLDGERPGQLWLPLSPIEG